MHKTANGRRLYWCHDQQGNPWRWDTINNKWECWYDPDGISYPGRTPARLRREAGWILEEAAQRGGFSSKQLHWLEADRTKAPLISTLIRLCKIYHTTPNHLLGFDPFSADDELVRKHKLAEEKLNKIKSLL